MEKQLIEQRIFHLAHCRGIGPISQVRMVAALVDNYKLTVYQLAQLANLPSKNKEAFLKSYALIELESLKKKYASQDIQWITILDNYYPEYLKQIYNPPALLFYRGNVRLLRDNSLAIVGSRKNTPYGSMVLDRLLPELIKKELVTVSGLAKGIDCAVHEKTILLGGKTIAVIGTGLDYSYPYEHKKLQKEIGDHHLVISEYPIGIKPLPYHFPMRNRIIAGVSLGTLVVEAQSQSGSLITANFALQEGREVFAVPGPITSLYSEGTNQLITQGAKCVLAASHILEEFIFDTE
ncbi:DNA processing protein [Carnobacterium iners]|uniref:DNA processing protein n=1 Tax=Carnobacterium iners TaxID=1073423 RepID=A0A1X7NDZ2_9LACT|nr:DNA-processing protein DprA [Carnobacterium iners]SEK37912.1 DNA processing protein [Carnobacterium iners]SMH35940.1 DNA processing protein [Carnobacterium iners]